MTTGKTLPSSLSATLPARCCLGGVPGPSLPEPPSKCCRHTDTCALTAALRPESCSLPHCTERLTAAHRPLSWSARPRQDCAGLHPGVRASAPRRLRPTEQPWRRTWQARLFRHTLQSSDSFQIWQNEGVRAWQGPAGARGRWWGCRAPYLLSVLSTLQLPPIVPTGICRNGDPTARVCPVQEGAEEG